MLVCAVALAPLLWEVCDRRGAMARLAPVPAAPPAGRPVHNAKRADLVTFLSSVTRSLRSGSSATRAIIEAPSTCGAVTELQERLRRGDHLRASLGGTHRHILLLRACMHGDVLSTAALDAAVEDERLRAQAHAAVAVAVAQARRSARVLTVLPYLFLAVVLFVSSQARNSVLSPSLGCALALGTALNVLGRRWITRLVRNAARPDPHLSTASEIATTCAVHLAAGGSVTGCFETLAGAHARCAEVASLLNSGHLLSDALRPLEDVAPQVTRTILDAHRDGLPVTEAMMRLAGDLRGASAAHIHTRIAEVSVRTTTPLVLCVLPSFLLIAVAPLALATLSGLSMPSP